MSCSRVESALETRAVDGRRLKWQLLASLTHSHESESPSRKPPQVLGRKPVELGLSFGLSIENLKRPSYL